MSRIKWQLARPFNLKELIFRPKLGTLSTKLNYRQLNLERMKTRMHSCAPNKSANNNTYLLALVPFIVMFWPLQGAIWPFLKYYNQSQNSDQIL